MVNQIQEIAYYPGCTMKSTISNGVGFELSALASAKALGLNIKEMEKWYCCGTVYSMISDDVMKHISSARNLIKLQDAGSSEVVTLCSMCYQTMEMANQILKNNPEKRKRLALFMTEESEYLGEVQVHHFLPLLNQKVGIIKIQKSIKRSLKGLRVAPYYGCAVTRPKTTGFDSFEDPHVLHDLLKVLGAEVVENPFQEECCGSYHTVSRKDIVSRRTYEIAMASIEDQVDMLVLTCPLCQFNLDTGQKLCFDVMKGHQTIPVVYFTQLLAIALGLDPDVCKFENHYVNPIPILQSKKIIK